MIDKMIEVMHMAAERLHNYASTDISLFHHNDTDGISSGAILVSALADAGFEVSRYALEKPYPQLLKQIFTERNRIVIFADFAGRIAPLISELNGGRNLVLILDHHPAKDADDPNVINIDAELFGLKGDRDISASAVCYLFAEILLKHTDTEVSDYSHLGVLGALGDGFLVDGALSGVNSEIMNIARDRGLMRSERGRLKEDYYITVGSAEYPADDICTALDTAGGVGYYQDGPEAGVRMCLEGFSDEDWKYIEDLMQKKELLFSRELKKLESNIHTTANLQWFDVKDRFEPMGVKMIGVFCNEIKDMDFLDKTKYLAGFQEVPDIIPGFGKIAFNSTKISMRVSEYLTEKIRSGALPGLNAFLPPATRNIGGFVDACHGLSAATTVRPGEEELLIEEVEKEIQKRIG